MLTPISQSSSGSAASTAAGAASGDAAKSSFSNGDFETFLRMLTTQIRNQDPLNPMEGSDFAVQLATFSGVEQQAYTNKLLTQMMQQSGGSGLADLAGWIGKEARSTAPVAFRDAPLTLEINPDARADSVQLVTRDANGREILREEIGPGAGQVAWLGRDAMGDKLPDGTYAFTLESWADGSMIEQTPVEVYGRVIEAETTQDGVNLILDGGGAVLASEVTGLREPASGL